MMSDFKEHMIEWDDDKVRRLWDFYSRTPPYKNQYFAKVSGANITKIISKFKLPPHIDILDFGGGKAFMFDHCKTTFKKFTYTNIDFSKNSVEASVERLKKYDEFKAGLYIESLPTSLLDNSMDVVFLIEVLEHLEDEHMNATLSEICRVLKPTGKLVITTPNDENLESSKNLCPNCGCTYHKWQHVRSINSTKIKKILSDFEFTDIKVIEATFNKPNSFIIRNLLWLNSLFKEVKYENLVCVTTKK